MSIDATRRAWSAPVKNSSQRLVLLSIADRAGENHTAWPSIERLAADTVLDKKTVQKVILELIESGLIADTGERVGVTKRVRVLKLIGVSDRHELTQNRDHLKQSPKSTVNTPKNRIVKSPQNGMTPKMRTFPKTALTMLMVRNSTSIQMHLRNFGKHIQDVNENLTNQVLRKFLRNISLNLI